MNSNQERESPGREEDSEFDKVNYDDLSLKSETSEEETEATAEEAKVEETTCEEFESDREEITPEEIAPEEITPEEIPLEEIPSEEFDTGKSESDESDESEEPLPKAPQKIIKYLTSSMIDLDELQKHLPDTKLIQVIPTGDLKINNQMRKSKNVPVLLNELVKKAFKVHGPIMVSGVDLAMRMASAERDAYHDCLAKDESICDYFGEEQGELRTHFYYTDDGENVKTSIGSENVYVANEVGTPSSVNPLYPYVGFQREFTTPEYFLGYSALLSVLSLTSWFITGITGTAMNWDFNYVHYLNFVIIFPALIAILALYKMTSDPATTIDVLSETLGENEFDDSFELGANGVRNFLPSENMRLAAFYAPGMMEYVDPTYLDTFKKVVQLPQPITSTI